MATQITPETRRLLAERSAGVCEICGRARATEASHRRPKGMGGTSVKIRHAVAWLIHACHGCHQGRDGIESDRDRARMMGWLVGPLDDAAVIPVYLHTRYGVGWWLLDDSGCYRSLQDTGNRVNTA
jgi:hypothetical protein